MAEQTTFVKVDRNIVNWRWYQDANTIRVFLHLIINANIVDHDFERITVHRGEIVTSIPSLANSLNMSVQAVRTALGHLKLTGEITCRRYPHYQVISIPGYDRYQAVSTVRSTVKSQSANSQITDNQHQSKNIRKKEGKEGKNSSRADTTTTIRVPPSVDDISAYCRENGLSTDIDAFIRFNESRGWMRGNRKVKDWRPLLAQWIAKDSEYNQQQDHNDELDEFGRPIRKEFE